MINAVSGGNTAQIKYFVEHGAIKALCDLLVRADLMGPAQPLEALPSPNPSPNPSPSSRVAQVEVIDQLAHSRGVESLARHRLPPATVGEGGCNRRWGGCNRRWARLQP